ncbi:ABC transporter permease subunit [Aminipila butyrica]|uniref:ABC transporter permease subunit n=1 Tax=Aminipila butyrica TaxID=433296 RepID=A0A858BQ37_9FIRM|nr:ABC transporter permease subunit [Aminipila butyrica]QIB67971.1 ABC transporter permease subunit [Aminipila butyrica]
MKKVLNITNIFFLIFLLIQFLPNQYSNDTYGKNIILFIVVVEGSFLLISLIKKEQAQINTAKDVIAIAYFLIIVWQLLTAKTAFLSEELFPAPGTVIEQFIDDLPKIIEGIRSSLLIILEGYILAVITGIPTGLIAGWNKRLGSSFRHVSQFLGSIPPIVYIPYAIALLPTFRDSSVFVIFAASFWPIVGATMTGVVHIERKIIDSARTLNVGNVSMLFHVMLPAALPQIFIGCNQGLAISFILLTSAEMIGGKTGMGFYIKYYSDFGDFTRIVAGIIVLGIVVSVITFFFNKFQKYLLRWKQ